MRVNKEKAMNLDANTLLTIAVGIEPNVKRFFAHQSFLCTRSDFFSRALSGNWTEKKRRIIKLPEDDPDIFGTYLNLVYTGQVATSTSSAANVTEAAAKLEIQDELKTLSKLYVLSEKLCDVKAKNATISAILATTAPHHVTKKAYTPEFAAIKIMYDGTPKSSLGRQLMVDLSTSSPARYIHTFEPVWPREFLVDLATALLNDRPQYRECVAKRVDPSIYLEKVEESAKSSSNDKLDSDLPNQEA